MIAIEHTLVSDEIVEEQFVCDLGKCKGGCCEDGDAGAPLQNDELDVILFDVWIYKKGWVQPQKFIDEFGHLGIPNLIYQGELDEQIINDIQENKFNLKEGVMAKGVEENDTFMMKIKTKSWLRRVKTELGEKALLEDMDGNKKHLII